MAGVNVGAGAGAGTGLRVGTFASAAFAGLLFGTGLVVSGMSDPRKVRGFLDIGGNWDPSLAFVMIGAIGVGLLAFGIARRWRRVGRTALLGEPLPGNASRVIDGRLLLGSATFGVGWGLSGFCPGPAVVAAAAASQGGAIFLAAVLAGMLPQALRGRALRGQ